MVYLCHVVNGILLFDFKFNFTWMGWNIGVGNRVVSGVTRVAYTPIGGAADAGGSTFMLGRVQPQ